MLHLPLDDTFVLSLSVYVFKGKFLGNFNFSHPLSYLKYLLFMMKVDLYQTVYHVQQYSTKRSKIFHTDMRLPGRVNQKATSLLESTENRLKASREPPNQPWKSTSEFVRATSNPMEEEMVTHSSILAWRIPWTEEPGRLQSTGVAKSRPRLSDFTSLSNPNRYNVLYEKLALKSWKKPKSQQIGNVILKDSENSVNRKVTLWPKVNKLWQSYLISLLKH